MGFYQRHVLPRIVNLALDNERMNAERKKCLEGARGRVLEVGFGSGLNLPFYPTIVERLVGIDPSLEAAGIAKKRIKACPFVVEARASSGEQIDAESDAFDCVVTTFTLCTIPDVATALREMKRVLKPGGAFLFLEHGRAEDSKVARWQDRVNPIQNWACGGCNLTRKMDDLIAGAGFELCALERYYVKGPRIMSFLYRGVAEKPLSRAGAAALA